MVLYAFSTFKLTKIGPFFDKKKVTPCGDGGGGKGPLRIRNNRGRKKTPVRKCKRNCATCPFPISSKLCGVKWNGSGALHGM
jgi:hypothetical protein